ncbi:MAG TPA: aminotransferase class V-fold PLP-dependent enzyme [Gaiellaceae bacterium]|nr:aminotransferase class V-fold PLP-dependent enzyme [Gaiellaceae bacterium]
MRELLRETADRAADFLESLPGRPVFPPVDLDALRARLGAPLPEGPSDPREVLADLAEAGGGAAVGIPGGRYFGFVIGGALPAALAADWLTSTWDQNAGLYVGGPAASVVEEVAGGWLAELLRLPADASFAFVTGTQMAHATALAAARHHVLAEAGWDVERRGLSGAPAIRIVAGARRHATIDRSIRLLGLGTDSIAEVPVDEQGRMLVEEVRDALDRPGPTIVCAQAGEVNTGAFDPFAEIADAAAGAGAWLHVDGAFGLWAAASPRLAHLVAGAERADSWSVDGHKWLNVPYDSGIVFCARPDAHRAAMTTTAAYLVQADPGGPRDQMDWTPEFSRRARGFALYAAIRSLGRQGIAELVERCCDHARRFAEELGGVSGAELLNEVVLNQVLFRFETDERTAAILRAVQESGEAWMSGTTWQGRQAIRISVSNWQTTEEDVARAVAAFRRAAGHDD